MELNPLNAKNHARVLGLDALLVVNKRGVHLITEKRIGLFYVTYTRGFSNPSQYDEEGNVTNYKMPSKGVHKFWKKRNK